VKVEMTASSSNASAEEIGLQAAAVEELGNFEIQIFKINYQNVGSASANGALLEFRFESSTGCDLCWRAAMLRWSQSPST
jgi:hypothetical protein